MPRIKCYSQQIQQVLMNLLTNARDALDEKYPEGNPDKIIRVTAQVFEKAGKAWIRTTVEDHGTGISPEIQEKMFDPFFTTKEPGKGTGLGLASVYGTVRSHNGAIEVYSESGNGTTFTIFLPLAEKPVAVVEQSSRPVQKGKAHILVVDDEEMIRTMAAKMLQELGYTVDTCADGEEAVDFFAANRDSLDLIIVDMIMPRMGGYDCVHRLKEMRPDVKIIITTGYSIASDTQRILTKGIAAFIQKPFEMEEFAATVADVLAGKFG